MHLCCPPRLYQSQQAELDRLHEELKQAQTSLASKDAQLAAVSESGDQAASLQQCQDELEKKDVSIKKYADYYQYQRGQIEKLQAELTEAKASITSKDEQLASATGSGDQAASLQQCQGELEKKDVSIKKYADYYQYQKGQIEKLQAELTEAQASITSKDEQLASATAALERAEAESTSKAAPLDFQAVVAALMASSQSWAKALAADATAIFEELKTGETEKIQVLAKSSLDAVRGAASSTVAFVRTEVDEHVPEPVKQKAAPLDFQAVVAALMASSQSWVKALAADASAIFEELKTGKTEKIQVLAKSSLDAVRGAASSTVAFVRTEVDEHVPEPVKQKVMELFAQAKLLWQQNVIEAAWMKPLLEQLASLNAEVKKVLTDVLSKTPALAPYADPVSVQLAVYGVFGLPVLLVLVLPLALASRSKQAAQAPGSTASKKKKKSAQRRA
ncbi:uncharacterized protein HaLaN_17091 [Haematococcus lacustris]|uniref:Uncharacterized protein n=1 Tax=Haematococcus lacustris TaxID=44745 RepID=A0A699ZBI0_HAELA|nr:uncharacterized protein HaLaN_17091 [Haematococcus lacustris]